MSCVVTRRDPHRKMTVLIDQAILVMTAREQAKLFRHIGTWITEKDAQRVIDYLAYETQHPVGNPRLPKAALPRFINAMPKSIRQSCKIPITSTPEERKYPWLCPARSCWA